MIDATAAPAVVDNLIGHLRQMTEQLWEETLPWRPDAIVLPGQECLADYRDLVLRLDEQMPTDKSRAPGPWAAFRRVASRYPGWRMDDLIAGWVNGFSTVPVSPRQLWIRHAAQKGFTRGSEVIQLLDELGRCRLPAANLVLRLDAQWPYLFTLASHEFRNRYQRGAFLPLSIQPDSRANKTEHFTRWALINDLLAQQADWNSRFGRFDWFPAWVAAWQNDAMTAKIRGHLPQSPETNPAELREARRLVTGRRRIERHRGSGGFQKGDILRLEEFANRLRRASDPVADFIVSKMSAEGLRELRLSAATSPSSRQLESTLLQELTQICHGPCIHDGSRFGQVTLRPEAKKRLGSREIQTPEYQTIKPGMLADGSAVAADLKSTKNHALEFLWEGLQARTREALDDWDGKSELPLRTKRAMVSDLNSIILGPSIWDAVRFEEVTIPFHVRGWLAGDLSRTQVAQLNLLLIEQVLPLHTAKGSRQVPLPNAAAFRKSLFRLNRVLIEDAFAGLIRATVGW